MAIDNSPAILTAIGVTGTLTTAYLTAQATVKSVRQLDEEAEPKLTASEVFKAVWKNYIPAAATATLTVAATIGANSVSTRRAAAVAVAYSVTEKAFTEYREKVVQHIGDKKEEKIRHEIAQARVDRDPVDKPSVIVGQGRVLCYEEFTGRFFYSDMETLRKAQNDINAQVINDSYASLDDFYDMIGLPQTSESSEIGWNVDRLLNLQFSAVISEGRPCISVGFSASPIRGFARLQ